MAHQTLNTNRAADEVAPEHLLSIDPTRVLHVIEAVLLLSNEPCENQTHPSRYAHSLMQRLVAVGILPGALDADSSPQALAFLEAASVLGAYVRRLENVARIHGHCGTSANVVTL